MRNLTVGDDVAAVIGAQRSAELAAGPYPVDYRCARCRRRGRVDDGEPLTVLDNLGQALTDAGRAGRLVGATAAVVPAW